MKSKHEVRVLPARELRIAAVAQDGFTRSLTGTSIVYGVRSQPLGGFVEIIDPAALNDTLAGNPDILLLNNHDTSQPIARSTSGTLALTNTSSGLNITAQLDTRQSYVNDLAISLERKDVRGMSFGFVCTRDSWQKQGGVLVRTVEALQLLECSVVSNPAYLQTQASVRSCPAELRAMLKRSDDDDDCGCQCSECLDGDCEDCSNLDCADPNCDHGEDSERSLNLWRLGMQLAIAKRR
jgi:uncharacterized protein